MTALLVGAGCSDASVSRREFGDGLAIEVPSGWAWSTDPLVRGSSEVIWLATSEVEPGESPTCPGFPAEAVSRLPSDGALLSLSESNLGTDPRERTQDLREQLGAQDARMERLRSCVPGARHVELRSFCFVDGDRVFCVNAILGTSASTDTTDAMWEALNSFSVS
ncbi:MAG: hypothetical protein M3Z03_07380 [Actinomycetota bacterium]|nr:hypothetical protein [Actinomycetota bacterium]